MSKSLVPLTPEAVIKQSGNSFHLRVAEFLSQQWWIVEVSPYYTDFVTSAPREVDIIAYKKKVYKQNRNEKPEVCVQLFIECKYLDPNNTIVTRTQPSQAEKVRDYLSKESIVSRILGYYIQSYDRLSDDFQTVHHYCHYQSVAKLFGNQTNEDPMFKWINQVLHSLIYFEKNPSSKRCEYTYNYPIVLVNSFSNVHEKKAQDNEINKVSDSLLFATNYSYTDNWSAKNKDFFVDIVDENWLNNFLTKIDNELERYKTKLANLPSPINEIIPDYSSFL